MKRWLEAWQMLFGPVRPAAPAAPPRAPERIDMNARINWQAEMLKEADMNWAATPAEAEPEPPTPTVHAPVPLPTVPPAGPRREHFSLYGYEPGQKPPSLHAFKALTAQLYDPILDALPGAIVADTGLFGALDSWNPREAGRNLTLLRLVFDRLSLHLGEAYGFTPAPLGRVDQDRKRGGFYDPKVKRIFIASSHLTNHPGRAVNTIAHEQIHHLQYLLIDRLLYAPRKLSPTERSLALFFHDASHQYVSMHKDFMAYSYNGLEYHARHTGNTLAMSLCPVFGWQPEETV